MIFFLFWALCFVLLVFSPFVFLLLYGVIASERDALGIAEFINIFSQHKLVFRTLFILSFIYCVVLYIPKFKNINKNRLAIVSLSALLCSLLILVVSLMKDYDIIQSFSLLVYSGLPCFFIWILTYNKKQYRSFFLIFVVVQGVISFSVLVFPELSFINGFNYQKMAHLYSSETINFGLPSAGEAKGDFARYGHFHNPNALGFYSCVLMMVSIYLFLVARSKILSVLYILLFFIGLICWFNSLTRGPFIALSLYLLFVVIYSLKKNGSIYYSKSAVLTLFIFLQIMLIFILINFDILLYFFPDKENASVSYRLIGYINGIDAFISNPLLGVGGEWVWLPGYNPHFLPITWLAEFGILFAIIGTFFVYFLPLVKIFNLKSDLLKWKSFRHDYYFAIGLYLTVLLIASTNNITATVLFWVCLAEFYIIMQNINKAAESRGVE